MKNVLIVIPSLTIGGGAEKVSSNLSHKLKYNFNVHILTFSSINKNEHTYHGKRFSLNQNLNYNEKGKNVLLLKLYYTKRLLCQAQAISKICLANNIHTIISFVDMAGFATVLSKLYGNKSRIIVSVRNMPFNQSPLSKTIMSILYKHSDIVVAVTKSMQKFLENNMHLKRVTTIYNPTTPTKKGKIPDKYLHIFNESNFIYINIGRLVPQKGHIYLLQAFKSVAQQHPHAKLVILGEGKLRPKLKKLTRTLGLDDCVHILGNQTNIYPFLKSSDCFVLSSLWEGFPNVLTEALSVNLPIISSDCKTGPREILVPDIKIDQTIKYPYQGQYGILLETPLSSPNEFCSQLSSTMTETIKELKILQIYKNNYIRAKDFDTETILTQWKAII